MRSIKQDEKYKFVNHTLRKCIQIRKVWFTNL
jgi:hypothetical protein